MMTKQMPRNMCDVEVVSGDEIERRYGDSPYTTQRSIVWAVAGGKYLLLEMSQRCRGVIIAGIEPRGDGTYQIESL